MWASVYGLRVWGTPARHARGLGTREHLGKAGVADSAGSPARTEERTAGASSTAKTAVAGGRVMLKRMLVVALVVFGLAVLLCIPAEGSGCRTVRRYTAPVIVEEKVVVEAVAVIPI